MSSTVALYNFYTIALPSPAWRPFPQTAQTHSAPHLRDRVLLAKHSNTAACSTALHPACDKSFARAWCSGTISITCSISACTGVLTTTPPSGHHDRQARLQCNIDFYEIADLAAGTKGIPRSGLSTWSERVYSRPTNKCQTLFDHGRLLEMTTRDMSSTQSQDSD